VNRNRAFVFAVALLCVAGLAVAAATVDVPRSSDPATGNDTGNGAGGEAGNDTQDREEGDASLTVPPFARWLALAVFAVALVTTLLIGIKQVGREDAKLLLVMIVALAVVGAVAMSIFGQPVVPEQNSTVVNDSNDTGTTGGDSGRDVEGEPKTSLDVPILLVGVFGLLAIALVAAIARYSGSESAADVTLAANAGDEGGGESVGAVGEAAGRAADRLEASGVDADNAVYDAWREMTAALSVERPATTTPSEFADAAVAAGMDREDVAELTWLFEEVRYGDEPVTDERERRATEALRNIESTYAEADDE